jgi:hypothetical protein
MKSMLGMRFVADALVTQWVNADMQAQQAAVGTPLPATINVITPPRRGDRRHLLIFAYSDVDPGS